MQDNVAAIDQVRKYWHVIRWDATGFLSLHDNYNSRLFYDKTTSNLLEDLIRFLRGIAGGIARSLLGLFSSISRPRSQRAPSGRPYVLLITVGGPKYVTEEREIVEACRAKGLAVSVIYSLPNSDAQSDSEPFSVASTLMPQDYIWALSIWLWELARRLPWLFMRDRKQRNLFVAANSAIWQYYTHVALSKRLIAGRGAPRLVISLLPSAAVSVTIVDQMKMHGVLTAAIRTQTTSYCVEHLVINTDILFYKSLHEKVAYENIYAGKGPRLEAGCLLSLPEVRQCEPLDLPEKYVLLLGTAPTSDSDQSDFARYNEKLFQVAAAADLPVVFKSHDLGKPLDDVWFSGGRADVRNCLRINEVRRNRELIERATLVVSTVSTLLYYVILCNKPLIIVESKTLLDRPDEFQTAPITKFAWHQQVEMNHLDWNALSDSCHAAKLWVEENYCLKKGPDYILEFLLKETEHNAGTGVPAAAIRLHDAQVKY